MTNFDKFDHHEYGLIRISDTEYVRCTGPCCKSGSGLSLQSTGSGFVQDKSARGPAFGDGYGD